MLTDTTCWTLRPGSKRSRPLSLHAGTVGIDTALQLGVTVVQG